MLEYIEKWFHKIRPYILKYKDGFFELPFIGNSPQLMWESFKKMPYCTFHPERNSISANNLFLEGEVYCHELEDGLVWIHSALFFKQNVIFKQLYNKQHPIEHYCVNCFTSKTEHKNAKTILHDIHIDGQLWFMLKPGAEVKNYHFKNTQTESISFYFTRKWYDAYQKKHGDSIEKLNQFIQSLNEVVTCNYKHNIVGQSLLSETKRIMQQYSCSERSKPLEQHTLDLMHFFKTECLHQIVNEKYFALSNLDRIKIIRAEEILNQNIKLKFPGIECIAQEVCLSETKLKSLFKTVHGVTLFDYFQHKKMTAARALLDDKQQHVADIAASFGYENGSKFAAAFKKQFNQLPSEITSQSTKSSN